MAVTATIGEQPDYNSVIFIKKLDRSSGSVLLLARVTQANSNASAEWWHFLSRFMAKLRLLTAALTATAALTGCVSYQPRELNAAAAQTELDRRTLRDPGLQRFLATLGRPMAEDWDLERLTLAAFYFSPVLDLARAQLAETEAGVRTARARPNPTLTLAPGHNTDAIGGITPWIMSYALNVPVETGGKRAYRVAVAQHNAEAARFEVARMAWAARAAVRRSLVELHAAEATAEFWRNQKPLLARAAQLVDVQVRAGEVSPLEAGRARIALNRSELAARESERAVAAARSRLAESIGVPLAAFYGVRLSYKGLAASSGPIDLADARRWAAQNRVDLLAALASYAASQSALQLEIARQYPDLSFGPGYQLDQGEGKWSLSLGVTLPVFHQNQGPIAAAQARRDVVAAQFVALQNRVMAEVDRTASDYTATLGDLETIKAMRASLEQQAKRIQAQQAAGETSRLDLARAQIELADNARAELEARLRAEQSLGAFEEAVQRPLAWAESAWQVGSRSTSN